VPPPPPTIAGRRTLAVVLGTRPEAIKLAPVLAALRTSPEISVVPIVSGQQPDLLGDFLDAFAIAPAHRLAVMRPGQTVGALLRELSRALDPVLRDLAPQAVLVQGDTSTALAAALVAACAGIPVVHVEAGLRTGDLASPWPEEINRVLISHASSLHCAATTGNVANLVGEGVPEDSIALTGNPVVDTVTAELERARASAPVGALLAATGGGKRLVLTVHRRENFGSRLDAYLRTIADFVAGHPQVELIAPVHPNPEVGDAFERHIAGHPRVHLVAPLGYHDFLCVLRAADLVLSDSGGIQEEIAAIGTPLIVLREKTERPEILATPLATLAPDGVQLERLLSAIGRESEWPEKLPLPHNPFGDGRSGPRIAAAISDFLGR
jgi:UDP-N-acetylglucosamine 2-epimerase (non-hydrolysing)